MVGLRIDGLEVHDSDGHPLSRAGLEPGSVDGPLPDSDPDLSEFTISQGRVSITGDRMKTARHGRELTEAKRLSIRELMIEVMTRPAF